MSVGASCAATIPALLGLGWAVKEIMFVRSIKIDVLPSAPATPNKLESGSSDLSKSIPAMLKIAGHISEGATAFLNQEFKWLAAYMVLFSVVTFVTEYYTTKSTSAALVAFATTVAFVIGGVTSIACGYVGMKTAVFTNVKTTHECIRSLDAGFNVALRGGSVMGFVLVSLAVLAMFVTMRICTFLIGAEESAYECLAGFGLGGSSIALFARVGGGIYTKAADVGADLSGKNEYGMNEDDPRNPACIADNVGDNVGDIAGMGADLFGSFAEATCAAMVILAKNNYANNYVVMVYPLLLSSLGILAGIATMAAIPMLMKIKSLTDVEKALKYVLGLSTVLQLGVTLLLSFVALRNTDIIIDGSTHVSWGKAAGCVIVGLVAGLFIGGITEYYTSHSYRPVREVAETQKVSAATGIIYGLSLGYVSCLFPVILLAVVIVVSHFLAGMFGIALAAIGMLGTLTVALTIDAYGPISDNAGGIAEMSELGPDVRERTDALDAAGNTTAAIGKGFAIGSAALVALALFGAFMSRFEHSGVEINMALNDPWVFAGLLYGAMMPFLFSAMTMKSVGKAATDMVKECMQQFPKIMSGAMLPQYARCIEISTNAALREMVLPGALVILSPIIGGAIFGASFVAGMLNGALVAGVMMAISMSNTGGAWDNAKKYIEAGGLGPQNCKGSAAHKNAVTGDTVGDPLKDTSGPSLNILIKLSAIISVVFAPLILKCSNETGGPAWKRTQQ
jgi:H+-translocating diphosphatase